MIIPLMQLKRAGAFAKVDQLGLNNATAHRFLMTLEAAGALRATKRGYFALGPKIDELGQVSEETGAIGILLQPELEAVSVVTSARW